MSIEKPSDEEFLADSGIIFDADINESANIDIEAALNLMKSRENLKALGDSEEDPDAKRTAGYSESAEKDGIGRIKASGSLANLHHLDRFGRKQPPTTEEPENRTEVDPLLIAEIEAEHDKLMNPKDVNKKKLTKENFDPAAFNYLAEFTEEESVWNQDEDTK